MDRDLSVTLNLMANHPRLPYLLIPLAALLATLPLAVYGTSCGHDLAFHLLSWQDAALQFAHGNLHPRWAFLPAWGAGEPRFVFYPPLSWTIGALLTLLSAHLPAIAPDHAFALVPVAYTWLALTLAGLGMFHLARRYVTPSAATLAATIYLANPYTLFTAYERTAFAELLAAAWLPLLLAAILPPPELQPDSPSRGQLSIPATASALALLWLTNAPAAVIGSYALALVVLLRVLALWRTRRPLALRLALRSVAATALGLPLAAFYIVPAATERRWVAISMAVLPGLRPSDNTLFHHTADPTHDQVLHTASLLAVLLLVITAISLLLHLRTRRNEPTLLPLAVLTLAIALLLTPWSLPLWHHLPELAFLQFPWRLLALLAPITVLSAVLLLRPRLSPAALLAAAILIPATLVLPSYHLFHQPCDSEDTPQASFALVHALTHGQPLSSLPDEPPDPPTDEYTPLTADNDRLLPTNPPIRVLPPSSPDDLAPPPTGISSPAPLALDLDLKTPSTVVLNLRNYPLWVAQNNGEPITIPALRDDGLLALTLPAGHDHLRLTLRTPPLEITADALSLLAAALLLLQTALHLRNRNQRPNARAIINSP